MAVLTPLESKHIVRSSIIAMCIALSSTVSFATGVNNSEWRCIAGEQGGWNCTEEIKKRGTSTTSFSTSSGTSSATTLNNRGKKDNYAQWDWVSKSSLENPGICDTGCEGAYIDPAKKWPQSDTDPELMPILTEAESISQEAELVHLRSNVIIKQGNRRLRADSATINRNTRDTELKGDVEIREPNLLIRTTAAHFNADTGLGEFQQAKFLFHDSGLRGIAQSLSRPDPSILKIENGRVTQCTPDDETWAFEADTITLDQETGMGTAKQATLVVNGLPVFYIPYITFPIDDRRISGFLWPSFGASSDGGIELNAPYYFNIAPNIDATVAPRYISKRGTMAEVEMRYLNQYGQWLVGGAQLKDQLYTDTPDADLSEDELNDLPPRENRWLTQLQHSGKIAGFTTGINYSKVSDGEYFSDLSVASLEVKRASHLNQQASLKYARDNWQTGLLVQQMQTLDEDLNSQYKLMPQLSITRSNSGENFAIDWQLELEISDFQHDEAIDKGGRFTTGKRSYIDSGISYPMRWSAGFVIPSVKVRSLNYDLESFNNSSDDSSLSATTAMASVDMGMYFERNASFAESKYLQTLEPRLYYLYSEYKDQSDQPDFDSRELTFSYSQLFRDTRFSGRDRLIDADQVSIGVTNRFIEDSSGLEVITASIGQIFYLEDRRVTLSGADQTTDNSHIASEIQYQPTDRLWFSNSLLWNSRNNKIVEGGLNFHYQTAGNSLYNLGYRFRREGDNNLLTGKQDLEQVDASFYLPIHDQWTVFSRFQYDLTEQSNITALVGLQYEDCCWKIRMLYQEGFEDEYLSELDGTLKVENDYAFVIEFQLKGLGNLGNKASTIIKESILGYENLE